MSILENEVWISCGVNTDKYYESLGYEIPKVKNKKGKLVIKPKTKILVKVEHLKSSSRAELTKVCDVCGEKVPNQSFKDILRGRKRSRDKLDRCNTCSIKGVGIKNGIANLDNCVATTHPEFAKLFWNEEDTYVYAFKSNKKIDFKCPDCGEKVENKAISNTYKQGLRCSCKDSISYPEKFMHYLLKQLGLNFKKELSKTTFEWCGKYRYDFYIPLISCIIETHGIQHYEETNRKGRTLEYEQINDNEKCKVAMSNGINEYIVVDCRRSTLDWMKSSIMDSALNGLYDLSIIDWNKCHEFALNSLTKLACEMWNDGSNVLEISEVLKLNRFTVIEYLKKGTGIWCNYDPKEAKRKSSSKVGKKSEKKVIQLDVVNGKIIKEWKSNAEICRELNYTSSVISDACRKGVVRYGFHWQFKDDYNNSLTNKQQ